MHKIKRQMYIEYKDPNRMMVKGGIILDAKDAAGITDNVTAMKAGIGGVPGRRRGSQKFIDPAQNSTKNLLVRDEKKSAINLLDKKEIEIVKGLF